MDIFFTDPTAVPLPPAEVRIRQLHAEPWQDRRRVRVTLEITPFQQRPNGEISISDAAGNEVSQVSFIETIDPRMEFTMHLRSQGTTGEYLVTAILYYEEPPSSQEETAVLPAAERKRTIVDQGSTHFLI